MKRAFLYYNNISKEVKEIKKKNKNIVIKLIPTLAIVSILYYLVYVYTPSSGAEIQIKTNNTIAFINEIKKESPKIKDIRIHFWRNKLNFDFSVDINTGLDECKNLVRGCRDFVVSEGVNSLVPKEYGDEETLVINFDTGKDRYTFTSPYYMNGTTSLDRSYYKKWFININDGITDDVEIYSR